MASTDQDDVVVADLLGSPPQPPSSRFQFSLSTMFWVTTGTAVLCALLFPMPSYIAIPAILLISVTLLPAVWTTVIIYGRGNQRTFGIGAMFPTGFFLLFALLVVYNGRPWMNFQSGGDLEFRLTVFSFWAFSLIVGGVCVGVRKLVERRPRGRVS